MNWNNLPGAKCVLLRYQLRSVNPVRRALVFAFTPIKCKSKERKIKQLLEGYPNFILRILLLLFVFGHVLSCFFFLLKCCWSAEMLISSLSGQLKDFQFIFACHLLKKDWIFFFLPAEESISITKAAAASLQGCTIVTYISYSLSASRH